MLDYLNFLYCPKWPISLFWTIWIFYIVQNGRSATKSCHISLNLTKSHRISQNLNTSCHISQNLTISHQISMNLNEFHHSWPNHTESYKISPYLTESHQLSSYLTDSHQISPNLTKTKCQSRTSCGTILRAGHGVFFYPPAIFEYCDTHIRKLPVLEKIDKAWGCNSRQLETWIYILIS